MGIRNSKRSQIKIHSDSSSPNKIIKLSYNFEREIPNSERRDIIYVREKAICEVNQLKLEIGFISPIFFVEKKGGGHRPHCHKSQGSKWFHGLQTFQDGGRQSDKRHNPTEALVNKNRSERCLFYDSNLQCRSKIPGISLGGKIYQFLCLPFGITVAP